MKATHTARLCLLLLIVSTIFIFPSVAKADSSVGFSVAAVIPENQVDPAVSYYHLKMRPGQQQDLSFTLNNSSNQKTRLQVQITYAQTNTNGLIIYTQTDADKADSSLLYPLTSIASLDDPIVELAPGQSKTISIHLRMPKESIDGVVLGAVRVMKLQDQEQEEGSGISLFNQYAYVVGIMLEETQTKIVPELLLTSVAPTLYNYRTAVAANLQNPQPAIISDMKIDAKIYKVGSGEILHQANENSFSMAPNSSVDFMIGWENKPLQPGDYRLVMTADAGVSHWEWDQNFTIEKEAAQLSNSAAVGLNKPSLLPSDLTTILIDTMIALVIVVILLIVLLHRSKKNQRATHTNKHSQ